MTQTYEGYWWPAGSDDQTAGRLEIGADRIELKLNGRFGSLTGFESVEYAVVYGMSGTHRITLRQAWETSSIIGTGLPTQEFTVGSVWLGAHLDTFSITALSLQIEHLAEWFEISPPRRTSPHQADGSVTAAHVPRNPLRAEMPGTSISVQALHGSAPGTATLTLSSVAVFGVDFAEPRTYDDADRAVIRPLLNLIALATTRPPAITELVVTIPSEALQSADRAAGSRQVQVMASWLVPAGADPRLLAPEELAFRASDLAQNFTGAVGSWFRTHEEIGTACDLFFGNIVAPPQFLETKFIVHCQATEALHAKRFPSLRVSPEEHAQRVKRVVDAVTSADKVWVEPAIRLSNQKSLRDRVTELTQSAPASVRSVIGAVDVFADHVARSRNELTHGASLAGAVDELFVLNEKLRLLLHAHFMRELGLTIDAVDALLERSRLLRSARFVVAQSEKQTSADRPTQEAGAGPS